jgi:hypothetical protein|tara:strand:- start:1281 stop:1895 length:615 start_codon:yes stop_codon:yes gene_type:complete
MREKIILKGISDEEFHNYKFCKIKRHHDSVLLPKEIEHANLLIIPIQHENSFLEKNAIDIGSIGEHNIFVFRPNFPECIDYSYTQTIIRDEFDFMLRINNEKNPIGYFSLYYLDWVSRTASLGLYLNQYDLFNNVIDCVFKVSFQLLNLRQLSACVVSGTQRHRIVSERNEFEKLGTLRKMFNVDGNYSDAILYSVHQPIKEGL